MARKDPNWIEYWFKFGIDVPNKAFFLQGEVDSDLVDAATCAFHMFEMDDKPVTIFMNCPGGDEVQGMAVYDLIKNSRCHVTIRVTGEACSMGAVILQAADIREALPHAVIMHHSGDANSYPSHKENNRRFQKFMERYDNFLDRIMLDRVNEKRLKDGLEPKDLSWWKKQDTWDQWLLPEDAIQLGLLDRIVTGPT
jgi:ATP-dependent Clp protease protease subunit